MIPILADVFPNKCGCDPQVGEPCDYCVFVENRCRCSDDSGDCAYCRKRYSECDCGHCPECLKESA
jgi:hypothetical protein